MPINLALFAASAGPGAIVAFGVTIVIAVSLVPLASELLPEGLEKTDLWEHLAYAEKQRWRKKGRKNLDYVAQIVLCEKCFDVISEKKFWFQVFVNVN